MSYQELANLAVVLNQLKTIINTSGLSQFSKEKLLKMKNKVAELEREFLDLVLSETEPSAYKLLSKRVNEEKEKLSQSKDTVSKVIVIKNDKAVAMDPSELSLEAHVKEVSNDVMGTSTLSVNELESVVPPVLATEISISNKKMLDKVVEEKQKITKNKKIKRTLPNL